MLALVERQALGDALDEIWRVIRAGDGYIAQMAPWSLAKTDPVRMGHVLRMLAELLRVLGILLSPFMPFSMVRLLDQLGVPAGARDIAGLAVALPDAITLAAPQGIFPRLVEDAKAKH